MKWGFIPHDVLPPIIGWVIIDEEGKVLYTENKVKIGNVPLMQLPSGWVENCSRWYDSLEELNSHHALDML